MWGRRVKSGNRSIFGENNLEKEAEKWCRDGCGLKGEFLFLFLKMEDNTACLCAGMNDPAKKQKCDEIRTCLHLDWKRPNLSWNTEISPSSVDAEILPRASPLSRSGSAVPQTIIPTTRIPVAMRSLRVLFADFSEHQDYISLVLCASPIQPR